jgi:hypothetical protein
MMMVTFRIPAFSARSAPDSCLPRSFALRHGSCLLPLKLCFACLQAGDCRFCGASRIFGSFCRGVVAAVVSAVSVRSGSIRDGIDSFSRFRLRGRKPFDGVIPSSGTVGIVPPHWLAVTTPVFPTDCVRPHHPNRGWTGALLGLRLVSRFPPCDRPGRARSPPRSPMSQCGGVRPPPGERVTYALDLDFLRERRKIPRGRERQFVPTISPDVFSRHPALSRGLFPGPREANPSVDPVLSKNQRHKNTDFPTCQWKNSINR